MARPGNLKVSVSPSDRTPNDKEQMHHQKYLPSLRLQNRLGIEQSTIQGETGNIKQVKQKNIRFSGARAMSNSPSINQMILHNKVLERNYGLLNENNN